MVTTFLLIVSAPTFYRVQFIQKWTACHGKNLKPFPMLMSTTIVSIFSPNQTLFCNHSSISITGTRDVEEPLPSSHAEQLFNRYDDEDAGEKDNLCESNVNCHYRPSEARTADASVLGKTEAIMAKRPMSTTEASNLKTQDLISKLVQVARIGDIHTSTTKTEQLVDLLLSTTRSWFQENVCLHPKKLHFNKSTS